MDWPGRIEVVTGGRQKGVVEWGEGVTESVEDPGGESGDHFEFQPNRGQREKYLRKYISKYSGITDFSRFETQGKSDGQQSTLWQAGVIR